MARLGRSYPTPPLIRKAFVPGIAQGNAALTATSTLTAGGLQEAPGAATLAATSTLTAEAVRVAPAAVSMSAGATLTAAASGSAPGALLNATATLTANGVVIAQAAVSMSATADLTVDGAGSVPGETTLAATGTLTVDGLAVRQTAVTLAADASLTVNGSAGTRLGATRLVAAASLSATGQAPTYARLVFQDMEAVVTPPGGYLEPLPLTVGPNSRPGDVRLVFVSASAQGPAGTLTMPMKPDPPAGFVGAYTLNPGYETEGVYYRRLVDGDADTEVAWVKPPNWQYFAWSLLSVRGVDPSIAPIAGRLTMTHIEEDAFCRAASVSVPAPGVMVFLLGTVPDPAGLWPSWATSIGVPTGWKHLVATDKSGDKFFEHDNKPALALVGKQFTTSGATGTVTFPIAQGAPAMFGMWVFLRAALDGVSTGGPITSTASVAAGSSSSGADPHSAGEPITASASVGTGFNPLHGYIKQTYRLPGRPVEASIVMWDAVTPAGATVTVETSINNGLSWDVAENWKPVPRLRAGDNTTRTVLVRGTLTRESAAGDKPRLKWLKVRIGCRKSTDELIPTFFGPIDKTKTKITAGSGGGTGGSSGGGGAFARGGGLFGSGASVRVHATDPSRLIKLAEWEQPFLGPTGYTYTELGRAMVLDRLPGQDLFSQVSSNHVLDDTLLIWGMDQGGDPWADIRGVYTAIGHECFFDGARAFVSRPVPDPRRGPVVWDFDHAVRPVMIGVESELDTNQIVNGWVIKGESTSSANPVSAYAFNLDTASKYNIYPPPVGIGKRIKRVTFPLAKTAQQCQDIANGALNNSLGLANTVKIGVVAHPGISIGDVARVNSPETGVVGRFLVQGYELPDSPVEQMQLTCFRQTDNP